MIEALISFLGGSAFRFAIGWLTDFFKAKQDHAHEMERMELQSRLDQAAHERNMALVRFQADAKLGEIKLSGENAIGLEDARAFTAAQERANQPTGVRWIDGWNGVIRPGTATFAACLWALKIVKAGFTLTAWDENLIASVLGYFFADRHIGKSRK